MLQAREKVIERLVKGLHLPVQERLALGSPPSVHFAEIAEVVARILQQTGSFPPNMGPWREGNVVHEEAILQAIPNGRFRLTLQRSDPVAPTRLAQRKQIDFEDCRSAIEEFIKAEWANGIDGIAILQARIA
jgi:hypothetical protein